MQNKHVSNYEKLMLLNREHDNMNDITLKMVEIELRLMHTNPKDKLELKIQYNNLKKLYNIKLRHLRETINNVKSR